MPVETNNGHTSVSSHNYFYNLFISGTDPLNRKQRYVNHVTTSEALDLLRQTFVSAVRVFAECCMNKKIRSLCSSATEIVAK